MMGGKRARAAVSRAAVVIAAVALAVVLVALMLAAAGCGERPAGPSEGRAGEPAREGRPGATVGQGAGGGQDTGAGTGAGAGQGSGTGQGSGEGVSGFPVTVRDATGVEVTLGAEPQRIVSLLPSNTEIAFALGLGPRVVGVTEWCDYPEEAKTRTKIGSLKPDVEKVISLMPDLVLAGASANADAISALRQAGVTVFAVEAKDLPGVYLSIQQIGRVAGAGQAAEALIESMKKRVDAVQRAVAGVGEADRVRVWVEITPDLYTAGRGTFIDDLMRIAGGVNVAGDVEGWAQLNSEAVIERNPQVIVTAYGPYVKDVKGTVTGRAGWDGIDAVKADRIYSIDPNIVTRPGPRLVEGLEQVARALYPELFK